MGEDKMAEIFKNIPATSDDGKKPEKTNSSPMEVNTYGLCGRTEHTGSSKSCCAKCCRSLCATKQAPALCGCRLPKDALSMAST